MNYLRKLAVENKKLAFYLVALVALGVFALMLGRSQLPALPSYTTPEKPQEPNNLFNHETSAFAQEQALETRLEEFFSLVEGAGRVRVMISPLTGRETVFAVDVSKSGSASNEEDSQGGTRETHQYQSQEQTVIITDRQGTDTPLILREIDPQITGIVIIAEGGDSPFVRDALTRAARAMLGVDAHNIQVLTGSF